MSIENTQRPKAYLLSVFSLHQNNLKLFLIKFIGPELNLVDLNWTY